MNQTTSQVELKVYDVSRGMARTLASQLLGQPLEGVWHTSLLVFNKEFFYGGGVKEQDPEVFERENGLKATRKQLLGSTTKTYKEFVLFLKDISHRFTEDTYDLIKWNCNHFTNTCLMFLLNKPLQNEYLDQHAPLMASPMGSMLIQMLEGMKMQNPVTCSEPVGQSADCQSFYSIPESQEPSQRLDDALNRVYETQEEHMRIPFLESVNNVLHRLPDAIFDSRTPVTLNTLDENIASLLPCWGLEGENYFSALGFKKASETPLNQGNGPLVFVMESLEQNMKDHLRKHKETIQRLLDQHQNKHIGGVHKETSMSSTDFTATIPKYATQLEKLSSIGFTDIGLCIEVLKQSDGNLNTALDLLLSSLQT